MKNKVQLLVSLGLLFIAFPPANAQVIVGKRKVSPQPSVTKIPEGHVGTEADTLRVRESRYELRCRGITDGFQIDNLGPKEQSPSSGKIITLRLNFRPGSQAAGEDGSGLEPGTCSFADRTVNEDSVGKIEFETPANAQLKQQLSGSNVDRSSTAAERFPDARTIHDYLKDPNHYWSFFVVNTNDGYFQATGHQHWKKGVGDTILIQESDGRSRVLERAEPNTQRTVPEQGSGSIGSDQSIIIVGGKKPNKDIRPANPASIEGRTKPTVNAPTLTASPSPVIVPKGQAEGTTMITWDAGPTFPYCEVYMEVDGQQSELGRGHNGTKTVTIQLGRTYHFWMIVYLGDQGETVTEVARMTVVGQEGDEMRKGPLVPDIIIGGPPKGPLVPNIHIGGIFFSDVDVVAGASSASFSFTTAEPSQFWIEVSKQRPSVRTGRVLSKNLQANFPPGAQLAAFTLPGLSGAPVREHQVQLRGVPGQSLEPNTNYYYVIAAKGPDGAYWRHVDQFTTLDRIVKVFFEGVRIHNDSDPDIGPFEDCGEIDLWFWANYGEPNGSSFAVPALNNNNACSNKIFIINRELVMEGAPNTLSLSVSGEDHDRSLTGAFRGPAAGRPPLTGPEDTGDFERNVAAEQFDLSAFDRDGEIPFDINSVLASGRQGDLNFRVWGRILILHRRQ